MTTSNTNDTPTVSVIVIFLNVELFIREAVESVIAQTYGDWELLLVDDGSYDASTGVALEYAGKYPEKVRYLEHAGHQNLGASAARNLGIGQAKGKYIALLDADDVWLPHKLEEQVKILNAWPKAGMLFGNTQFWHSWTGKPEDAGRDFQVGIGVEPDTLIEPPNLLTRILRGEAPSPCTCSALLRREAVERVGGFEKSFRRIFTDQAFYAKLFLQTPVIGSVKCWDKYRRHPASCVSTVEKEGTLGAARLRYLQWLEGYLSDQDVKDTDVWYALRRAFWAHRHPGLSDLVRRARPYLLRSEEALKSVARRILPDQTYAWLKTQKNKFVGLQVKMR